MALVVSAAIPGCASHIFFGTSAQFWLNLQTIYDLRLPQEKSGRSIKALPTPKRSEPVNA
jgi:antitoxin HigA-1